MVSNNLFTLIPYYSTMVEVGLYDLQIRTENYTKYDLTGIENIMYTKQKLEKKENLI